jgi:hypothetical protein
VKGTATKASTFDHVQVTARTFLRRADGATILGGQLLADVCGDGLDRIWTGHVVLMPARRLVMPAGLTYDQGGTSGLRLDQVLTSWHLAEPRAPWRADAEPSVFEGFPVVARVFLRRASGGTTIVGGELHADVCRDGLDRMWTGAVVLMPERRLVMPISVARHEGGTAGMTLDGVLTSGHFEKPSTPPWREE